MINIGILRNVAKVEYLKEPDNCINRYYSLVGKITEVEHGLLILNQDKEMIKEEVERFSSFLGNYQLLEFDAVSEKTIELLTNPKYAPLLANYSERLGNVNFENVSLVQKIQKSFLLSNMWYSLRKDSDQSISGDLNKFVIAMDIVLEVISKKGEDALFDMVDLNSGFDDWKISFVDVLCEKERIIGKEKIVEMLDNVIDKNNEMTSLPIGCKVKRMVF